MARERMGENAGDYHIGQLEEPFTRYPGNPILTAKDMPYPANSVFNAGRPNMGTTLSFSCALKIGGTIPPHRCPQQGRLYEVANRPRPTLPADPDRATHKSGHRRSPHLLPRGRRTLHHHRRQYPRRRPARISGDHRGLRAF